MGVVVEFHGEFIEAAKEAFAARRLNAVVVLLATAVEQRMNVFYRDVLVEKDLLTHKEITEVIRNSNIGPKIGWLLTLVTEYEICDELRKRVLNLTELRNQIVHYKASPSRNLDDMESGSDDIIRRRIENLDFDDLFAIPDDLSEALDEALEHFREKVSPDYRLAKETAEFLLQGLGLSKA